MADIAALAIDQRIDQRVDIHHLIHAAPPRESRRP
jgi:hypothetical protein